MTIANSQTFKELLRELKEKGCLINNVVRELLRPKIALPFILIYQWMQATAYLS
jgi:hypothetical protein